MRIKEIINEVKVQSSWISDLVYNRPNKVVTWRLNNGKVYTVGGVSRTTFDKWKSFPSKGVFFHTNIKGRYTVKRIL